MSRAGVTWTEEMTTALRAGWSNSLSMEELCRRIGVSRPTALKHARSIGLPPKPKAPARYFGRKAKAPPPSLADDGVPLSLVQREAQDIEPARWAGGLVTRTPSGLIHRMKTPEDDAADEGELSKMKSAASSGSDAAALSAARE